MPERFFAAAWAIKKVMEEIYFRGVTSAFLDNMILFNGERGDNFR
jgi:hypothetical protein